MLCRAYSVHPPPTSITSVASNTQNGVLGSAGVAEGLFIHKYTIIFLITSTYDIFTDELLYFDIKFQRLKEWVSEGGGGD